MNVEFGDVLTLSDGNEYAVAMTCDYEGKEYYYLSDINKEDVKICYLDNDEMVVIKNEDLLQKLILEFNKDNTE